MTYDIKYLKNLKNEILQNVFPKQITEFCGFKW